jgi:hypothetical protein
MKRGLNSKMSEFAKWVESSEIYKRTRRWDKGVVSHMEESFNAGMASCDAEVAELECSYREVMKQNAEAANRRIAELEKANEDLVKTCAELGMKYQRALEVLPSEYLTALFLESPRPPEPTRADKLAWPIQQVRDYVATEIMGWLKYFDCVSNDSTQWHWTWADGKINKIIINVDSWQPDKDANQCNQVIKEMVKDGWDIHIDTTRHGDRVQLVDWSSRRRKGTSIRTDELPDAGCLTKVCYAACIAI